MGKGAAVTSAGSGGGVPGATAAASWPPLPGEGTTGGSSTTTGPGAGVPRMAAATAAGSTGRGGGRDGGLALKMLATVGWLLAATAGAGAGGGAAAAAGGALGGARRVAAVEMAPSSRCSTSAGTLATDAALGRLGASTAAAGGGGGAAAAGAVSSSLDGGAAAGGGAASRSSSRNTSSLVSWAASSSQDACDKNADATADENAMAGGAALVGWVAAGEARLPGHAGHKQSARPVTAAPSEWCGTKVRRGPEEMRDTRELRK